jgi:glutamate-1-semialdehyde 2,1-aminomutase
MFERGEYLPPSQFEAHFVSMAHTVRNIDSTIKHAYEAFKQVS